MESKMLEKYYLIKFKYFDCQQDLTVTYLKLTKWIEFFWRHLFLRKPICCSHLLDQGIITHFASIVNCSFEIFLLKQHFAELLWSTWLVTNKRRSLEIFCFHSWTRSSFQLLCNPYKSSINHRPSLLFAAIQTLSAICLKTDYVFLPFHGS